MTGSRIEIVTGGGREIVKVIFAAVAFAMAATHTTSNHATAANSPVSIRLGLVEFPATGSATAHAHFVRGVAALHSFWYEEALEAFQHALRVDPSFAMAWWGIAMTFNRPFVPGSDVDAGRRALSNISSAAQLTERERTYIEALRVWYADDPPSARARNYAVAMRKVHLAYPDDLEAAAFYALSLMGQGWPDEDSKARHLAAAAVAGDVYRRNPNHPGAAHYLIHSYDDPELADRGLDAARHYASIAPDAPHALHMPSHIFLQLGRWSDTTASNEAAWAASIDWVNRKQLSGTLRDYHNLHWLIYSSLQQGRYRHAAKRVEQFQAMRKDLDPETRFSFEKAVAAFVVETRAWERADALFSVQAPRGVVEPGRAREGRIELCGADSVRPQPSESKVADIPDFIRTLAAASLAVPDLAERIETLRASAGGDALMPEFWRVRILEVAAIHHANRGEFAAAITAMREATAIEEELGKPPGPPAAYKPPHELFGEILLRAGKPADAVAQFQKNLLLHPNRALSVLGLARAEAASGETAAAVGTYFRFLELWREADDDRPELREARDFVRSNQR